MKRVTIYEVAKKANVSLATVSRVINGSNQVREDTQKKVKDAIEKLGYKPNAIAQGLALQKTTTIALVIPEASFTYTGQLINGIMDVSKIYKYNVILHTFSEGLSDINDLVENIISSNADGVVIYTDKMREKELELFNQYNIPVLVIGNKVSGPLISSVYVDFDKVVFDICNRYLAKGLDNIAIIQDRKNEYSTDQLVSGAKRAFKGYGKEFDNYVIMEHEYRTSYSFFTNYFKTHRHDLIICYRDSYSLAVINAARENNIQVPEDMEVICIVDTKYNSMVRPQLSSFVIPSYDLGAVAMRVMTKMLKRETNFEKEIEFEYLFKERQSTKK
ncbi:MAG: LacI family DNA-binding transcriptional regulator [Erysipelotrichaceae bacterium]